MKFDARFAELGAMPLPTPGPADGLVARAVGKRQLNNDALCGFQNGIYLSSLTCQGTATCAQNTIYDVRGCCTGVLANCVLPTACVESTAIAASCGPLCTSDPQIVRCVNSVNQYCATKYYTGDLLTRTQSEIGCTSVSGVTVFADLVPSITTGVTGPLSLGPATEVATATVTQTVGGTQSGEPGTGSGGGTSSGINNEGSGGGGGGGLSEGAIIAIAVCVSVVGLAIIGAIIWFFWRRHKKNNVPGPSGQQYQMPPEQQFQQPPPPMMMQSPPPDVAGAFPHNNDAFHPNNFDSFNDNFSKMNDDDVAKARRFSNDATIDQTVAGRTNDDFRPQAP